MAREHGGEKMKMAREWLAIAVAVGMVAAATSSYAVPTLFLSDGVNTEMVAENSPLNQSTVPGTVVWSGSLGVWSLNVSTGISQGTGTSPNFDLNSVDAIIPSVGPGISSGPYTLQVWFGDVNLGPTSGSFLATIGGTTAGSVTYNTFADGGDTLFAQTLGLTSQSFNGTPFSGSQSSGDEFLPFPYSLSQEVIITQTGGATSFDATLVVGAVPEGGMTLVLLGSSLIALWAFGRAHKSVRA
jgi:hypothetical protein